MSHWIFTVTDQYYENALCREYWTAKRVFIRRMKDRFWGIEVGVPYTKEIWIGDRVIFYVAAQQFPEEIVPDYAGRFFAGICTLDSIFTPVYDPLEIQRLRMGKCDPRVDRIDGVKLRNLQIFTQLVDLDEVRAILDDFRQAVNIGFRLHGSIRPIKENEFNFVVDLGKPRLPLPNRQF